MIDSNCRDDKLLAGVKCNMDDFAQLTVTVTTGVMLVVKVEKSLIPVLFSIYLISLLIHQLPNDFSQAVIINS